MHAVVLEKFFSPIITNMYICIFIVLFLPLIRKGLTLFMHKTEPLFLLKDDLYRFKDFGEVLNVKILKTDRQSDRQTELATGEQNSSLEL